MARGGFLGAAALRGLGGRIAWDSSFWIRDLRLLRQTGGTRATVAREPNGCVCLTLQGFSAWADSARPAREVANYPSTIRLADTAQHRRTMRPSNERGRPCKTAAGKNLPCERKKMTKATATTRQILQTMLPRQMRLDWRLTKHLQR
jgi:hypothetical protein